MLLLGLLACAYVTAQRISPNISNWGGPDFEFHQLSDQRRLWERGHLDSALASLSLQRLGPVMAKLNSGQPIVVAMFGSSITQDLGGVFYTDATLQAFTERLGVPNHKVNAGYFHGTFNDGPADNGVTHHWGNYFMRMVNTTWPHVQHALINYGAAGASLQYYADFPCLAKILPIQLDLLILESTVLNKNGAPAENLMTRLVDIYRGNVSAMPAMLLIQSPVVVDHKMHPASDECIRQALKCATLCGPTNASTTFTHVLDGGFYSGTSANGATPDLLIKEHETLAVSTYYGIPMLSYRSFLVAALRDGLHTERNLSECQFLSALFGDAVHPRHGLGTQLFGEMLFNVLYQAELFFAASPSFLTKLTGIPAKPLFARNHVTLSACVTTTPGALPGAQRVSSSVLGTPPGWEWREFQQDGTVRKHKPGWVSRTPGSVLEIQFDASVGAPPTGDVDGRAGAPAGPGGDGERTVLAVISHLGSYQHMGQAWVACVSNCKCADSVMEGHLSMHVSVPVQHQFNVTAASSCVVRVTVLGTTLSGGNKVKVLSVLAKVVSTT